MTDTCSAPVSPIVQIDNLDKRFGQRWILRDARLRLNPGEKVCLTGESGTGKSTLLNIIAGLETCDGGTLSVLDHPMQSMSVDDSAKVRREHIGFVFQAFHLLPHLKVWQNVALPLMLSEKKPDQTRQLVHQLLGRLDLADRANDWPMTLSGGEQQRVALARALIHRPALVLADEPTGNLDPRIAASAIDLMNELVDDTGAALLMVTHSQAAARHADRQVQLQGQQLVPVDPGQPDDA